MELPNTLQEKIREEVFKKYYPKCGADLMNYCLGDTNAVNAIDNARLGAQIAIDMLSGGDDIDSIARNTIGALWGIADGAAPSKAFDLSVDKLKEYTATVNAKLLKENEELKKENDWIDVEDYGAVQDMIEPDGEGEGCSKPFLGQNDKGDTFIIYAICENDEGTWTDNIFGDATRENTWYEDIVKVKKINY